MTKTNKIIPLFIIYILSINYLISDSDNYYNFKSIQKWESLQIENIEIRKALNQPYPFCQVKSVIPYSINQVSDIIQNINNYPNVFKRITSVENYDDNVAHIKIDMPYPLSPRDYIIKFTSNKVRQNWIFKFHSVKNDSFPSSEEHVRLTKAMGEWRLTRIDKNKTLISYTWNGQLLGDFPKWALPRAWKKQGNEIIYWLNQYLSKK